MAGRNCSKNKWWWRMGNWRILIEKKGFKKIPRANPKVTADFLLSWEWQNEREICTDLALLRKLKRIFLPRSPKTDEAVSSCCSGWKVIWRLFLWMMPLKQDNGLHSAQTSENIWTRAKNLSTFGEIKNNIWSSTKMLRMYSLRCPALYTSRCCYLCVVETRSQSLCCSCPVAWTRRWSLDKPECYFTRKTQKIELLCHCPVAWALVWSVFILCLCSGFTEVTVVEAECPWCRNQLMLSTSLRVFINCTFTDI